MFPILVTEVYNLWFLQIFPKACDRNAAGCRYDKKLQMFVAELSAPTTEI